MLSQQADKIVAPQFHRRAILLAVKTAAALFPFNELGIRHAAHLFLDLFDLELRERSEVGVRLRFQNSRAMSAGYP